MALDKITLINDIKQIQDELKDEKDYETARNKFAEKLASSIEKFIKTGVVSVTTTGIATTQTGTGNIT